MSMQSVASPANILTPPKRNSLTHIPGRRGLADHRQDAGGARRPQGTVERMAAKYGLVYRSHVFGETSLILLGPEANELVLFDQAKLFSSTHGWGRILGLLFPRGLMLLDFEEHRLHRRALSVAFKSGPMKSYLAALDAGIAARVAQWKAQPGPMLFYPAMKQLTLDLAATSFLGAEHRARRRRNHPCLRRHGRGIGHRDPQAPARHANGARRQGPRAHRRLFLGTDSDPPRQGRRRPVLAAMPRHPRGRRAALDAGHRRSHEFPDDGRARHADLVADVVRGDARRQSAMAAQVARRSQWARRRRRSSPRHSTISKPCRSPRWRSRRRCG